MQRLKSLGIAEKGLSGKREGERNRTIHEPNPKLALQVGDMRGERLLRHHEPTRRLREALLLGQNDEVIHTREVQPGLPSF